MSALGRTAALLCAALLCFQTPAAAEKKQTVRQQLEACRGKHRQCADGCGDYYPNPVGEFQRGKNSRHELCMKECDRNKMACYDRIYKQPGRDLPKRIEALPDIQPQ